MNGVMPTLRVGDKYGIGLRCRRSGVSHWGHPLDKVSAMFIRLTEQPSFVRGLTRTMIAVAYLVIFAPVVMIVVTSFFAQEIVSFPPQALSLQWYANAWSKPEFLRGLVTSLEVALLATAI